MSGNFNDRCRYLHSLKYHCASLLFSSLNDSANRQEGQPGEPHHKYITSIHTSIAHLLEYSPREQERGVNTVKANSFKIQINIPRKSLQSLSSSIFNSLGEQKNFELEFNTSSLLQSLPSKMC